MTQLERTTPAVGNIPAPRRSVEALAPWTPTPPSGIRWLDAEPPAPAAPPRRSRRRLAWLVAAVLAVLAVGGGAAVLTTGPGTMTVQGTVVVAVSGTTLPGAPCTAQPVSGWTVSIFGANGSVVASAPVPWTGYAVDRWGTSPPYADGCRFDVLFTDVPTNDSVYRVGVGRSVADAEPVTRDELGTRGASITYGR
ncbi:hypothetical protein GCM10023201_53270 [Actinomycetospora corticicola]|uniref:Uncharacterized protein n=1 Tax=Actinomycetospora corticicola TaxID=663602 RepID=A0A7Y9J3T7_9PSEU|nr:hypothetical protein [Actinomycetospora corticicola]NYD34403.1 hypothetical protein [Actinomycetospora corticicola]